MMKSEFEQRTGYFPTLEQYKVIEQFYSDFSGDKDAFCEAYKKNNGGIAEIIQSRVDMQNINEKNKIEIFLKDCESKIAVLESNLEKEQEWKGYEDPDVVSQVDYERLASDSSTRQLSDEEAKSILYDWYGFAKEKITIYHSVPIYEVNRHRLLRVVGEIDRKPLYNATDWNYIRFNCGGMCYELHDDNLRTCSQ